MGSDSYIENGPKMTFRAHVRRNQAARSSGGPAVNVTRDEAV